MVIDIANIIIAIKYERRKSYIVFRLVYLYSTLAHFKGHANFDCEYLRNDDRYSKYYY